MSTVDPFESAGTHEVSYALLSRAINFAGQLALGNQVTPANTSLQSIESRQYQVDAWNALDEARQGGSSTALIHLATGLGKTTVGVVDALRFAGDFQERTGEIPKILFACHQTEILDQAADRFRTFAPTLEQGIYAGRKKDISSPITFATMQSLTKNLASIKPDQFDYIIYDEAHHMQADTFREVVEHFNPKFQVALTATPRSYGRSGYPRFIWD